MSKRQTTNELSGDSPQASDLIGWFRQHPPAQEPQQRNQSGRPPAIPDDERSSQMQGREAFVAAFASVLVIGAIVFFVGIREQYFVVRANKPSGQPLAGKLRAQRAVAEPVIDVVSGEAARRQMQPHSQYLALTSAGSGSPGHGPDATIPETSPAPDPSTIITRTGTRYERVSVSRVEPDGLTIEYVPAGGGLGLAKLKFKDLGEALQQKYRYQPEQAAAYETEQARLRAQAQSLVTASSPPLPVEQSAERLAKIVAVKDIAADYHQKHTYLSTDAFVCVDMACDVWDMMRTRGLNSKIMVGNVEKDIGSLSEANHAWVMAEVSPDEWLAIESTAGRVVQQTENGRYYRGRSFSSPREFKDFYYGRRSLAR